jgi:excisionase family DNA binding protein
MRIPRATQAANQPAEEPALLDVQIVRQLLNCSARHVYRMADAGRMPAPVRLGALLRWNRAVIEAWIANGCKPVRVASAKGGK